MSAERHGVFAQPLTARLTAYLPGYALGGVLHAVYRHKLVAVGGRVTEKAFTGLFGDSFPRLNSSFICIAVIVFFGYYQVIK